jgi:hypothetical protein
MDNYYQILGVTQSATQKEIKISYRRLMKEHDISRLMGAKNKYQATPGYDEDALKALENQIRQEEEICKLFNEAYETLSDPAKRKVYDDEVFSPVFAPPDIVISTKRIAFGTLIQGEIKSASFTVENKGGIPNLIDINWEGNPTWGNLDIDPDEDNTFPITVSVKIDTKGILSGALHDKVIVTVDKEVFAVEVTFRVEIPKKTASPPPPTPPPSTPIVSPTFKTNNRIFYLIGFCLLVVWLLLSNSRPTNIKPPTQPPSTITKIHPTSTPTPNPEKEISIADFGFDRVDQCIPTGVRPSASTYYRCQFHWFTITNNSKATFEIKGSDECWQQNENLRRDIDIAISANQSIFVSCVTLGKNSEGQWEKVIPYIEVKTESGSIQLNFPSTG